MVTLGWTLLPDHRGASIHRADPDHDGLVLCGRAVDPRAAVHVVKPAFDVCVRCAELMGEPVRGGGFRSPVADRPPEKERAVRPGPGPRLPAAAETGGEDEPQLGWVRLPGCRLHRPDPVARDRVICGQPLPANVRVLARRPNDEGWEPCPGCANALPGRMATARKRGLLDGAGRPKTVRRGARKQPAGQQDPLTGGALRRAWRSVGWVVLADKRRAHHPHPEHRDQVLCGRRLDPGIPVTQEQGALLVCRRCVDVLRRQQENLGLRTIVVRDSDRYERARDRGTSVWAFRGGLPTLGRDR